MAAMVGTVVMATVVLAGGCGSSSADAGSTGSVGVAGDRAAPVTLRAARVPQAAEPVVVDGPGDALYVFAPDRRRAVTCSGTCAVLWPPLLVTNRRSISRTGAVRSALIGTDADGAGATVATYGGWPLYRYAADTQANSAAGQGVDLNGGYWYLISPDGTPVVPPGDPQPSLASTAQSSAPLSPVSKQNPLEAEAGRS